MLEEVRHIAPLWRWTGGTGTGWFFVTIDGDAGAVLAETALMRRLELGHARGFGSIRVTAQIGKSRWQTSVFPSKEAGGYLLPVKAAVRAAEGLGQGDQVALTLQF